MAFILFPEPMTQRWTRRQTLWMLVGAAGGLALHACTPPTNNQSPALGLFTWVGSTPLYIAQAKGFFQNRGLNLDIKVFNANTDANTAFISRRLDAVSPVGSEAVTLAAAGKAFKIVLVQDTSVGADGILARRSITSLADFRGQQIAVEEGSVSHFFLLQVLNTVGLGAEDFTLINAPPAEAAAAYQSGNIPIAVTYAPFLQQANTAQPDGRIIYDSSQMPTAINDLYVFDADYASRHPEMVEAFVAGVLEGLAFLEANPEEGVAIASTPLGIPADELQAGLQGVRLPDLDANIEMLANPESELYLLNTMNSLAQFLQSRNQIQQVPDLTSFIDPRFVIALRDKQSS